MFSYLAKIIFFHDALCNGVKYYFILYLHYLCLYKMGQIIIQHANSIINIYQKYMFLRHIAFLSK